MEKFICKTCNKEKESRAFSKHKGCVSGYDVSACKPCKKAKVDWRKVPLEKRIYHRIKARSNKKHIEFDLDLEDIVLPNKCPILDHVFIYGDKDWTYSVDRIDNNKGYIKGNIQILSNRANRMKGDFTIQELQALLKYLL